MYELTGYYVLSADCTEESEFETKKKITLYHSKVFTDIKSAKQKHKFKMIKKFNKYNSENLSDDSTDYFDYLVKCSYCRILQLYDRFLNDESIDEKYKQYYIIESSPIKIS